MGDAGKTNRILIDKEVDFSENERGLRDQAFRFEQGRGEQYLRHGFGVQAKSTCEAARSKAIDQRERRDVDLLVQEADDLEDSKVKALESSAKGDLVACVEAYNRAIGIAPKSERLQRKLQDTKQALQLQTEGEELMAQQRYSEAAKTFSLALEFGGTNSGDTRLHDDMGRARELSGNRLKIEDLVRTARRTARDPDYDYAKADALYAKAISLDPSNCEAKDQRMQVRKQLKARAQLEQLCQLAELHISSKEFDDAVEVYTKALEIMVRNSELFDHDDEKKQQISVQRQEAQRLQELHSKIAEGRRKMMCGAYTEAITCFEAAHKLAPDDTHIMEEGKKANVLYNSEKKQAIAASLQREATQLEEEISVDGIRPNERRQKLNLAQKKRQDAAEALLDALHLDPRNQTLLMAQEDMARKAQIDILEADGLRLMTQESHYADAANKFNQAILEMSAEQKEGAAQLTKLRTAAQTFATASTFEREGDSSKEFREYDDAQEAYKASLQELERHCEDFSSILASTRARLKGKIVDIETALDKRREQRMQFEQAAEKEERERQKEEAKREYCLKLKSEAGQKMHEHAYAEASAIVTVALKEQPQDKEMRLMLLRCQKEIIAAHEAEAAKHANAAKVQQLKARGVALLSAAEMMDYAAALETFKRAQKITTTDTELAEFMKLSCKAEEALRGRKERVDLLHRARAAKTGYTVTITVTLPPGLQCGETFDVSFPDGHVEAIECPAGMKAGQELHLRSHAEPDWKSLAEISPLSTATAIATWFVEFMVSSGGQTEMRRARLLTPGEEQELLSLSVQAQIHLGIEECRHAGVLENLMARLDGYGSACKRFSKVENTISMLRTEQVAGLRDWPTTWREFCELKIQATNRLKEGKRQLFEESPPSYDAARASFEAVLNSKKNLVQMLPNLDVAWAQEQFGKCKNEVESLILQCHPDVPHTKAIVVKEHLEHIASQAFEDLHIKAGSVLNYMKFINWFKKELKKGGAPSRISDSTLQKSMKIWHEVDVDGRGVGEESLQKVLNAMIHEGLIKLTSEGLVQ
eukprot:SAG31_NODE_2802_length_5072_cov_27.766583_2_plen_1047_part_00